MTVVLIHSGGPFSGCSSLDCQELHQAAGVPLTAACLMLVKMAWVKMLVCSCNIITQREVEDTIREMLDEDPWQLVVPAKVLHTMNSRGRCCGCFPNLVETIIRVTEAYHRQTGAGEADVIAYLDKVRELRNKFGSKFNERRYKGHRAA